MRDIVCLSIGMRSLLLPPATIAPRSLQVYLNEVHGSLLLTLIQHHAKHVILCVFETVALTGEVGGCAVVESPESQ